MVYDTPSLPRKFEIVGLQLYKAEKVLLKCFAEM